MKKIKKELESLGYTIVLKNNYRCYEKKAFYGDGTYILSVFSILKNKMELGELKYKCTGRKIYKFSYSNNDSIYEDIVRFSQKQFIEEFKILEEKRMQELEKVK